MLGEAPRSASLATEIGTSCRGPRRAARRAVRRASRGWAPSRRARRSGGRRRRPRRRCRSSRSPAAPARRTSARARRGPRRSRRPIEWPRGRSTRTWSRTSPPSPTTATASESTSISSARTTAPSGFSADQRRRAARACRAARPAPRSRGPPATSSPMRPRIALRVSPVRATSSERDSGPRACSSRTIALRFARRTVSLRCPMSSRPIVTGFVFLSFKMCCATVVMDRDGVKPHGRLPDDRGASAADGVPNRT